MSEALAECEWLRGLFSEMMDPEFVIDQWKAFPSTRFVGSRKDSRTRTEACRVAVGVRRQVA
eukprot:8933237-Lingulodinium_polyedra.AAC.1